MLAAGTTVGVGSSAVTEDITRGTSVRRAFGCTEWYIHYQGTGQEAVCDKVCWRHQRGISLYDVDSVADICMCVSDATSNILWEF